MRNLKNKVSSFRIRIYNTVLFIFILSFALFNTACNNPKSDNKQKKSSSNSSVFSIDKTALNSDPINYLSEKNMTILMAYEGKITLEEKTMFINKLKQFDSLIINNLNNKIEAIGYLEYSNALKNDAEECLNIYVSSDKYSKMNKAVFYQEKFYDEFDCIASDNRLYNKAKQLQYSKIKFSGNLIYFDEIETRLNEFKKFNKEIDNETKLNIYKNYVTNRTYRTVFTEFEKVSE